LGRHFEEKVSPTFGQLSEKITANIWAVILRKKSAQLLAVIFSTVGPKMGRVTNIQMSAKLSAVLKSANLWPIFGPTKDF